jgi:hypothetical protein
MKIKISNYCDFFITTLDQFNGKSITLEAHKNCFIYYYFYRRKNSIYIHNGENLYRLLFTAFFSKLCCTSFSNRSCQTLVDILWQARISVRNSDHQKDFLEFWRLRNIRQTSSIFVIPQSITSCLILGIWIESTSLSTGKLSMSNS